jgi:hypothetical protein
MRFNCEVSNDVFVACMFSSVVHIYNSGDNESQPSRYYHEETIREVRISDPKVIQLDSDALIMKCRRNDAVYRRICWPALNSLVCLHGSKMDRIGSVWLNLF